MPLFLRSTLQPRLVAAALFLTVAVAGAQDSSKSVKWQMMMLGHHPFVSFHYGAMTSTLKGLEKDFADAGQMELRLGTLHDYLQTDESSISKFEQSYASIAYSSNKLGGSAAAEDLAFKDLRFGMSWLDGYGYRLGGTEETPLIAQASKQ